MQPKAETVQTRVSPPVCKFWFLALHGLIDAWDAEIGFYLNGKFCSCFRHVRLSQLDHCNTCDHSALFVWLLSVTIYKFYDCAIN